MSASGPPSIEPPPPRTPGTWRDTWGHLRPVRAVHAFARRQTSPEITRRQVVWDLLVGAALPPLLLWLDRAWDPTWSGGVVPGRPFVGTFAWTGSLAVVALHALRGRLPWAGGVLGGALATTALVSAGIGTVMLPLSILGIVLFGAGLLGLLPFVIAATHLRCAVRALPPTGGARAAALVLGAVPCLVLGAAWGRWARVATREAEMVVVGDVAGDRDAALRRLRVLWLVPGVRLRVLRSRMRLARTDEELVRLGEAWGRITGDPDGPKDLW